LEAAPPTKKKPPKMQQMYLDLGQSNFAKPTICNMCGMLYVHGLSEDATQHDRICQDYQLGVPFQLSHPRVVGKHGGGDVVVEVRPTDSYSFRLKVKRVRTIVEKDLGFHAATSSKNQPRTAYLYRGPPICTFGTNEWWALPMQKSCPKRM
jgi:hypothetical protein